VGNHGDGAFSRRDPYRVGQPPTDQLADRSVRRCRSQANMPGAFTARSGRAPDGHTGCLSYRRGCHRLQLMPGYLQAPDRGGHPLRWRRIIAGHSSALKVGTAGQLADFRPLAVARALMCGAEGKPVLRHGAGQAGAMDDGFGFDPGRGAEHVSERGAGHRNQDHLGAGTSPLSAA